MDNVLCPQRDKFIPEPVSRVSSCSLRSTDGSSPCSLFQAEKLSVPAVRQTDRGGKTGAYSLTEKHGFRGPSGCLECWQTESFNDRSGSLGPWRHPAFSSLIAGTPDILMVSNESIQNRGGMITPRLSLPCGHRWRAGSRGGDSGRRPRACRSARRSAHRGRAARSFGSSASAASCSYAWPRSR